MTQIQAAINYLQKYFGYDSFKQGQGELVEGILAGRDVLGIMPTGAGKSICYQLPAVMIEGITIVISPLISLMKDQVDALDQTGITTTYINSTLTTRELNERWAQIEAGNCKVVYIAPERLQSERFRSITQLLPISLVAIDEAHCVSQWGHDFRPSYMQIKHFIQGLRPRPVVAAFTATATDKVKEDIVANLTLARPLRVMTGYARENLSFSVVKGADKRHYLAEYVRKHEREAGIIYATTRKEVEDCHRYLLKLGVKAGRYHAGLSDQEREQNQTQFLYDDIHVMVATNAFGMGIDKSNVRFVIHYNHSQNLEAYYQEAGRAGRDGEPSECILLYAPQDTQIQKFLIEQSEGDDQRKINAHANLRHMVDYCHTTDCLQQYFIRYFGADEEQACGHCANCLDEREAVDMTLEAQQIFSCIVRMKQRFGITMTAKVLRGANDQRVRQFRFDQLSTYGIMKQYKEKEVVNMLNVLAADGYLQLSEGQYPVVSLTERARAVLQGEERVYQKKVEVTSGTATAATSSEQALFERLKQLRKQISDKERVPPFVIFHDATLHDMCARLPDDEASMLTITGVGRKKFDKYGQAFLACIREKAEEGMP